MGKGASESESLRSDTGISVKRYFCIRNPEDYNRTGSVCIPTMDYGLWITLAASLFFLHSSQECVPWGMAARAAQRASLSIDKQYDEKLSINHRDSIGLFVILGHAGYGR